MAMNWWRAHHGLPYDAKLGIVARALGVSRADVGMVWVACLDHASQAEDRGSVDGINPDVIAFGLDMEIGEVTRILEGFRDRAMIEPDGRLAAWDKRQPKDERGYLSTDRVHKFRGKRNQLKPDETAETQVKPDETERNLMKPDETTDKTRLDKTRLDKNTNTACAPASFRFEEVWENWPRKTGKDSACRDWLSVVSTENEAAVLACVQRYLRSDEVLRGAVRNLGSTMQKTGWLVECGRDGWACDWPAAKLPKGVSVAESAPPCGCGAPAVQRGLCERHLAEFNAEDLAEVQDWSASWKGAK